MSIKYISVTADDIIQFISIQLIKMQS